MENKILKSTKTVSSDVIPIVTQKGKRLYYIFVMRFLVYILFLEFFCYLFILPVLKSVAFTWCEEWIIAVQTVLW